MGIRTGNPKGRPKGARNKASAKRQEEVAASGMTPLEYMLDVMRDKDVEGPRRDDMAKAAAPYIHPKLTSIEHGGKDGKPIQIFIAGKDAAL